MLDHLRQRVIEVLAPVQNATLSTCGPAGIQAHIFPCQALGLHLYLLVPSTSDQLFNLEHEAAAVVTTPEWLVRGTGWRRPLALAPAGLSLADAPYAAGCDLVEIEPHRLQINRPCGWGYLETIDMDEF
jgi:hypothetical protein